MSKTPKKNATEMPDIKDWIADDDVVVQAVAMAQDAGMPKEDILALISRTMSTTVESILRRSVILSVLAFARKNTVLKDLVEKEGTDLLDGK